MARSHCTEHRRDWDLEWEQEKRVTIYIYCTVHTVMRQGQET